MEWIESDWWEGLGGRRFDLVVSNPPYVAAGDSHLGALRHEPGEALGSGDDGLDDLRKVIGRALYHLRPGGCMLVEHGHDQGETVRRMLKTTGFTATTRLDLADTARCSGGYVEHGALQFFYTATPDKQSTPSNNA